MHWNPEPDGAGLLRRHPLRTTSATSTATSEIYSLRARRHLAGGPRARPDRGAQVDDRHGPAAPRRAARADRPPLHAARRAGVGGGRCARSPTACSTPRCEQERVRLRRARSRPRSRCRSSPRSSASRRTSAAYIIDLGDRLLGNQDPEYAQPTDDAHRLLPFSSPGGAGDVRVRPPAGRRAAQAPQDDIITQLAFEPLTQREFDVYFVLLATAGNETTRHTITHGLLALLEHPDQLAAPARGPGARTSPPPRRCCAGRRPCTTSAARRRRTRSWRARRSPRARRSRPGSCPATATRTVFDEPGPLRRRPHAEQAHGVRPGRHPPLHGRAPRPDGDQDRVRGAAQARRRRSS